MKTFAAPKEFLSDIDVEATARLIATAADIALIVDPDGVIRDFAIDRSEMALSGVEHWPGQAWSETVTVESRPKIEALIRDAFAGARPRWRQVNHPSQKGPDVPVLYAVHKVNPEGLLIAFGRDLRTISQLQQRLIDAQQTLEQDYARLRHLETRYRLLFQVSSEPVLIVDGANEKVLEANPVAEQMFDDGRRGLVGRRVADCVDAADGQALETLMTTVRATGRADEIDVRSRDRTMLLRASVALLRRDAGWIFLLRFAPEEGGKGAARSAEPSLSRLVAAMPDGFLLTALDGTVLSANSAFLDLAQLATEEQARSESLDRWLGRPGVDLNVMLANLRERGAVRLFATNLRGEYGTETEVEISAASLTIEGEPCYAFAIRDVTRRLTSVARPDRQLPQSVEQLAELVGRVSLKDLVRQTTDVIEKMYIEAALEMTGENRASAAEMLGLSRQSLYVKLRRFELRDLDSSRDDSDSDDAGG